MWILSNLWVFFIFYAKNGSFQVLNHICLTHHVCVYESSCWAFLVFSTINPTLHGKVLNWAILYLRLLKLEDRVSFAPSKSWRRCLRLEIVGKMAENVAQTNYRAPHHALPYSFACISNCGLLIIHVFATINSVVKKFRSYIACTSSIKTFPYS